VVEARLMHDGGVKLKPTEKELARAAERASQRRRAAPVEIVDETRRWPWIVVALAVAAGGWGAWHWQQGRRSNASAEAMARAAQVDQAQREQQVEREFKVAWETRGAQPERAMTLFTKHAAQGNTRAMVLLGLTYGRPEHAKRMEWLRKAANEGEAMAFVHLGYLYETGDGEQRQVEQAANWYSKAARQGDGAGLYALGYLHAKGWDNFGRNPRQAWLLLELADRAFTASGSQLDYLVPYRKTPYGARSLQRELEKELSPVDMVKARELADTWKAGQPLPAL
jgi:uncharacterized protein